MSNTIRHSLPLLAAGQAQKEVTHNEALLAIDRQLQLSVVSRTRAQPPTVPVAGESFIVPQGASGAWSGHSSEIAFYDGYGWIFTSPALGCLAWIADTAVFAVFDGSWLSDGWPVAGLRIAGRRVLGDVPVALSDPVGGTIVDIQARDSLRSIIAALRAQGITL
jgi:hypothetical protein